jgi:Skp family chaperone for outer membrane proteins
MKTLTSLTLTIFCVLAFTAAASAQTGVKIAVINTEAFRDDKTGITKYVNAMKTLDTEFAPLQNELRTMATRIQTLEKDLKAMGDAQQKGMPVDDEVATEQAGRV